MSRLKSPHTFFVYFFLWIQFTYTHTWLDQTLILTRNITSCNAPNQCNHTVNPANVAHYCNMTAYDPNIRNFTKQNRTFPHWQIALHDTNNILVYTHTRFIYICRVMLNFSNMMMSITCQYMLRHSVSGIYFLCIYDKENCSVVDKQLILPHKPIELPDLCV